MTLRLFSIAVALWIHSMTWLCAQSSTPGGSVRLTVLSGGNLDFIFNSIAKYKSGITYTNYTVLGISVTDNAGDNNPAIPDGIDDYTTWVLFVEAQDADLDGAITGTNPANTLPFTTIEMSAAITAGCPTCVSAFAGPPYLPLPAPGLGILTPLVDGSGGGADEIEDVPSAENLSYTLDQVSITYRCGVTTSLLGSISDYYTDDIIFTLLMSP